MQIKTIIELNNICTLTDLRIAVAGLARDAPVGSSDIYFELPLSLRLEKSTLDDGAETYNLIVELESGDVLDDFNHAASPRPRSSKY